MPDFRLNDVVRVIIYGNFLDQVSENVLYYQITAISGTGPTPGKFATDYSTAVNVAYKAMLTGEANYAGITVQNVTQLPIVSPANNTADAGGGTAGVIALPRQSSGLIQKRNGFGGHRNRGRLYIPFPCGEDCDTDGTPADTYMTKAAALAAILVSHLTMGAGANTVVIGPVLYDRPSGGATALTTFRAVKKWATQKRRGSFGRPNPIAP